MNRYGLIAALLLGSAAFAASSIHKVNGSISVEPGQSYSNISTVNGSIRIKSKAVVGEASTVNGGIILDSGASADKLTAVNSAITMAEAAQVSGAVSLVNGAVTLECSADVSGRLANVNGRISLNAAHVGGGIETTTGAIDVGPDSHVEGGILVHECTKGWMSGPFSNRCEPPFIVIGPGAVVKGALRFEREVKLYVSDRATVDSIEGAKAMMYSGEKPPI
jgi:hypothetical protein